jgi:hypothetical protein
MQNSNNRKRSNNISRNRIPILHNHRKLATIQKTQITILIANCSRSLYSRSPNQHKQKTSQKRLKPNNTNQQQKTGKTKQQKRLTAKPAELKTTILTDKKQSQKITNHTNNHTKQLKQQNR